MTGVGPTLAAARADGRAALVAYLPVGFPDLATSIRAMQVVVRAGADVVEVGVPYTDPLMDGPVIQHAVEVALHNGTRLRDTFTAVRAVADAGAPALVMTYWNLVDHFGVDAFADELVGAGGSGLITPDLIPDEAASWLDAARRTDLDHVFLVAPSSTQARLRSTAAACRGFVYATAVMGVTGERSAVGSGAAHLVERVRAVSDAPVCVGLGVSTGEQAAQVAAFADGVIVGSALVRCLADAPDVETGLADLERLTSELAHGVRSADRQSVGGSR